MGLGNTLVAQAEESHEPTTQPVPLAVDTTPAVVESPPPKEPSVPATPVASDAKTGANVPDEKVVQTDLGRLTKQLKDLRDTWTQERQFTKESQKQITQLNHQIAVLTKKFDGTYDDAKDGPKVLAPEVLVEQTKQSERVAASHWAAVETYGEQYVMDTIWSDTAPFRKFDGDPVVQARVMSAKLPIVEAVKIVKEAEAREKYGADPEAMRQMIAKEVRAELEKDIRQQGLKEFKAKNGAFDAIAGLGGVASVAEGTPSEKPRLNFESLFPVVDKTAG